MFGEKDTIAAISTAMNNSGIGIIRISGEQSIDVLTKIFCPAKKTKDMRKVPGHTVHYGTIVDGGKTIDEVLVLVMRAPHTYTREDTVEIDCHGGMFVMKRVLELVLSCGVRAAEPGEFTKRAFLNGRIDLTQAEAVIDVINAENTFALQSAVTQLKGSVSEKVKSIRTTLLEQIAFIEAALDDPEHYDLDDYGTELSPVLDQVKNEIEQLLRTADDGRILTEGIRTVILGKPNVGKSSLLNALLGMERAIVTQIPGTTRDALEEKIRLDDMTLNIIVTAGIRNTEDIVERIGVDRSREYAVGADLIIWMIDASRALDDDDREILQLIRGKKAIILLNKQDLPKVTGEDGLECLLKEQGLAVEDVYSEESINKNNMPWQETSETQDKNNNPGTIPVVYTSVKQGVGISVITALLRRMFYQKEINFNDQVYITNMRQKQSLTASLSSLDRAMDSIRSGMPEDFYTIDLMDAYTALGSVIGETIEDDLADEIFSKFCMGK